MPVDSLFATRLYRAQLAPGAARGLNAELEAQSLAIAGDDEAGQRWCDEHAYAGYTSYASLNDLAWRAPAFAQLKAVLDRHARSFAKALAFDLAGRKLTLDSLWLNILEPGGGHSGHIHPHSLLSGTYYVRAPKGSGAIRFEDPRLPMMMAAPLRKAMAPADLKSFVSVRPRAGMILMWESWLRHEVLPNRARDERISVSFNYAAA